MSEKLKTLVNSTHEQSDEATKIAEDIVAQGQLMGRGFNYEVFEKESAPFAKALATLKDLPVKGLKAVKKVSGKVHKEVTGLGEKILLKTEKGIKKVRKGKIAPSLVGGKGRSAAVGYGALGLGGAGVTGTGAGVHKLFFGKEKQAAEKKAEKQPTMSDYVLRYQDEN